MIGKTIAKVEECNVRREGFVPYSEATDLYGPDAVVLTFTDGTQAVIESHTTQEDQSYVSHYDVTAPPSPS